MEGAMGWASVLWSHLPPLGTLPWLRCTGPCPASGTCLVVFSGQFHGAVCARAWAWLQGCILGKSLEKCWVLSSPILWRSFESGCRVLLPCRANERCGSLGGWRLRALPGTTCLGPGTHPAALLQGCCHLRRFDLPNSSGIAGLICCNLLGTICPFKIMPCFDGLMTRAFNPTRGAFLSLDWCPSHVNIFKAPSKASSNAAALRDWCPQDWGSG